MNISESQNKLGTVKAVGLIKTINFQVNRSRRLKIDPSKAYNFHKGDAKEKTHSYIEFNNVIGRYFSSKYYRFRNIIGSTDEEQYAKYKNASKNTLTESDGNN